MRSTPPASTHALKDFAGYIRLFQQYVGRRLYVVFVLSLLASLTEGFGIVMLLPLFESLTAGPGAQAMGTVATTIDRVLGIFGAKSIPAFLALIAAAFVVKGLIVFASGAYAGRLRSHLLKSLRTRLFDAYAGMDYLYYCRRNTGHFTDVIISQVGGFYNAFNAFLNLLTSIITTLSYFALAVAITWQFGVMALAVGLGLLLLFRRLNVYVRTLSRQTTAESGNLTKLLIQFLHAFKYLKATEQIARLRGTVVGSIGRLSAYQENQMRASALTNSVREPLAVCFIVFIVLVQIAVLRQPLAPIVVSILLFYRGLNTVLVVQARWQDTLSTIGSVERVHDELLTQHEHRERAGTREIGDLGTSIEFRDVTFAYDPAIGDVLHQVSFVIPARASVAVVGASGAGKSTVIDMLCLLLRPGRGAVLIDGVPGTDIVPASWRRRIGYVSQDTVVFDDTVANNICLWQGDVAGDPEVLQRIRDAARQAHIAEFVESLPDGYQTRVGERGVRLSGGQRQRLFIARELFKRPNLLILDEATSALDSESERAIQRSIEALRGHMTVVIIAHRLSTIRNVDMVLVFDHGRLVEQGSYDDLRGRENSRFGAMVALQSL